MADPDTPPTPPGPAAGEPRRPRRAALSDRARSGGEARREGKPARSFAVSVALHVAVAAVVLQVLTFGHGIPSWLRAFDEAEPVEERLTYVEPRAPEPAVQPTPAPVPATPTTPTAQPSVAPSAPAAPTIPSAPRDTGGGGPPGSTGNGANGVGAINPNLRGVTPDYTDARVWGAPGGLAPGRGRSGTERLDSVISTVLSSAADSLDSIARANGDYGRRPGDWTTTDKSGNKWGWDNAGIRLGKVTIPNALLSLLPLNAQAGLSGNPTAIDRDRRLSMARQDIQRNMTMGPGDAEFRKLANELRQRRERERRDRLRAPKAENVVGPQKSGN